MFPRTLRPLTTLTLTLAALTGAPLAAQLTTAPSNGTASASASAPAGTTVPPLPTFDGDVVSTVHGGHGGNGGHGDPGPAAHSHLQMVRLDGPVTTMQPAPTTLVLPVGARVLLQYTLEEPHLVAWRGAELIELTNYGSTAEFTAVLPGTELVRVDARSPDGARLEQVNLDIDVVAVDDFVELLEAGDIDASGAITAGPLPGDAGGQQGALIGGPFSGFFKKLFPGGGIFGGMIPGGGGGGGGGHPGPVLWCKDSCSIDASGYSSGPNQWEITFTVTNHGTCKSAFSISGDTGGSAGAWEGLEPFSTTTILPGGSKTYYRTITWVDTDPNTEPMGLWPFHVYARGQWTPMAFGGGNSWNCKAQAFAACFNCPPT
jgi:hypothetical protein